MHSSEPLQIFLRDTRSWFGIELYFSLFGTPDMAFAATLLGLPINKHHIGNSFR